jgi:23S rRNA (pseudouridine1915-N3)-methyltransferase
MKITLIVTGKTDANWLQEGIETYLKRLRHYTTLDMKVLPDIKNNRKMPPQIQKEKEGQQITSIIEGKNDVYLLEERGEPYSSRELAVFLDKKIVGGSKELTFIIGGPFGFSEEILKSSSGKISLSRLTFSHQMVRLLFLEQIYRAFTIIKGEPYHND